ncbi:MAG: hypothetical protein ACE5FD_02180 [Anaerolineae bacterium]
MKKVGFLVCLLVGLLVEPVQAHGGGTLQVGRQPAGPYLVSVWTGPPKPQANAEFHVTVGVIDPEDDTAVLDANVQVQVAKNGTTILTTTAATAEAANKLFYETDFVLEDGGNYDFTILVDGPLGNGETGFSLAFTGAETGMNPLVGLLVGLLVGALVGGTAFALIRRRQK